MKKCSACPFRNSYQYLFLHIAQFMPLSSISNSLLISHGPLQSQLFRMDLLSVYWCHRMFECVFVCVPGALTENIGLWVRFGVCIEFAPIFLQFRFNNKKFIWGLEPVKSSTPQIAHGVHVCFPNWRNIVVCNYI